MGNKTFAAKEGSAQFGALLIPDVRNIDINDEQDENVFASSSTDGKKARTLGHDDVNGSFVVNLQSDEAAKGLGFKKADEDTLILLAKSGLELFNGNVFILNISFSVPVEGGENTDATVNWGRNPC